MDNKEPVMVKKKYRKKKIPHNVTYGLDAHGFRNHSDSSKIVAIMIEGGFDRQEINEKIVSTIDTTTRNGNIKNIPSLVSGLLTRLGEKGYEVESYWRLVPPDEK